MRETGKLSALKVTKLKRPGRYGDGRGLWLQVSSFGTKAWVFRFKFGGRPRHMGLGSALDVSLAEARQRARAARGRLLDGDDPIEVRRQKRDAVKVAAAKRITFRQAAEKYITAHRAGWRNEKHADQWPASLESYAYPIIGDLPVDAVDTSHVMKILEPIWTDKTETANRVRGRLESVLDWAKARRYRHGDNPAAWRAHLENLLPSKSKVRRVQHHPAMPFAGLPEFMQQLRGLDSITAKALEFTILTCARTGAVIGATLDEIDLDNKVWTVPGARAGTKLRQDVHRVPLSPRTVEILKALPREKGNDHVFVGGRKGCGLSNMAMLKALQVDWGHPECAVHGFRSSFKDWASETTNFPDIVSEMALAHVVKDEVQAAYRRGELLEKRRRLMTAWSEFCARPRIITGKVVALHDALERA